MFLVCKDSIQKLTVNRPITKFIVSTRNPFHECLNLYLVHRLGYKEDELPTTYKCDICHRTLSLSAKNHVVLFKKRANSKQLYGVCKYCCSRLL